MNIIGKITGIKYKICLEENLKRINLKDFNINDAPTSCILVNKNNSIAISKWVSPKRTRSYPYERVYNTLSASKKITVIPIVKDEGLAGDRDFLQWDTVSLMSLLDVFVIFGYYHSADKIKTKITNQKFNNDYIVQKIQEIEQYHSSALHWNLNELNSNLHTIIDCVIHSYNKIQNQLQVTLHNKEGIEKFKNKIGKDVSLFMQFSRNKAELAQAREVITVQPKENLTTLTKAKITITNYLGGKYFFTVDEILLEKDIIALIEGKYSANSLLPSLSDIKDGLLKMILYSNLKTVKIDKKELKSVPYLELSSKKLIGKIFSDDSQSNIEKFFRVNKFSDSQKNLVNLLFKEALENKFKIRICQSI